MSDTVLCPSCSRVNGLRRATCIYCGAAMPVTDVSAGVLVPNLRPVEEWEPGFTVVLAPLDAEAPTSRQVTRLAQIAGIDEGVAEAIFRARTPLPVARVGTTEEAGLVTRLLGESELGVTVLSDGDLALRVRSRRVRELRFRGTELDLQVLWGDWVTVNRDAIDLAVEGRIVDTKVEIVEGLGRKRGTLDVKDTAQFYSESYAIDLYAGSIDESFRLKPDCFDYTCLGIQPGPRLDENVVELGRQLRAWLGSSRYDSAYRSVAKLLDPAWPPASHVVAGGLLRRGDFKKYTRSSVTTDALTQFTRYSRMRFALRTGA